MANLIAYAITVVLELVIVCLVCLAGLGALVWTWNTFIA